MVFMKVMLIINVNVGVLRKATGPDRGGNPVSVLPSAFGSSAQCGALPSLRAVAGADVAIEQQGD